MGGRWAVLAVWAAASGCVVSVGDKPPSPPTPEAVSNAAPSSSEFGVLMRPGDFHRTNPTLVAEVPPRPTDPPPIPVPSFKPPTEFVSVAGPPDSPVVTAVRHLDAGRSADAEAAGLPPGVLPLLASAVQVARSPAGPSGVGEVLRQLDAVAAGLAAQAPLEVTRSALCSDVTGFAKYDPLPDRPTLPAGKRPTTLVYLELRNVVAQPDGDRFVVALNLSLTVRDAADKIIYQYDHPPERVVTRSPRRDNCAYLFFRAPERPGEYTVTMRVQEPAAGGRGVARETSKRLGFTVK